MKSLTPNLKKASIMWRSQLQCTLKESAYQSMPPYGLTIHHGMLCCYTNSSLGCRR